jgi:hypothetical protein
MDGREAAKQLAAELGEMWYPKNEPTAREVFDRLVASAKENYSSGSLGYCCSKRVAEVEGQEHEVEFHTVGHNSSHQFSVGLLPDGRLVVQSCGDGDEWSEELGYYLSETKYHVIGTAEKCRWPYVGHW